MRSRIMDSSARTAVSGVTSNIFSTTRVYAALWRFSSAVMAPQILARLASPSSLALHAVLPREMKVARSWNAV
jgi:hypothetical protein